MFQSEVHQPFQEQTANTESQQAAAFGPKLEEPEELFSPKG